MRFPFSLTTALTGYLLKKKLSGQQRFPLVLMLEPLHACNLSCTGCGRIREYADTLHARMSVEECLAAVDECGAPVVSICGGEPLIYPEIDELVARILALGKHVYLCTNGVNLGGAAAGAAPARPAVRQRPPRRHGSHARPPGASGPGRSPRPSRGIQAARAAGFSVCTNTTLYRDTDMHEIAVLFGYLTELGVDGFMIAPAYGYEAVREGDPAGAERIFMTRPEVHEKFPPGAAAAGQVSPVGLAASTWSSSAASASCPAPPGPIPTRNVRGWRTPCYLIADGHCRSYRELLDDDRLGARSGRATTRAARTA